MKWSVKLRGVKLGGEAHFTRTETVRARSAAASCLAKYTRARLYEPNVVRTRRGPKVQKVLLTVFTLEHPSPEIRRWSAGISAGKTLGWNDPTGHLAKESAKERGSFQSSSVFCPRPNSSSRTAQPLALHDLRVTFR